MTSRTRKAALPSQGAVAMRLTQELRGHLTFLCSQRTREKSKHQSSLTAIVRNSIVGVATFFGVSHSMREVLEEDMRRLGILDVDTPRDRGERDGAVHRAGVEKRKAGGHCDKPRDCGLAGPCRSVNRNNHKNPQAHTPIINFGSTNQPNLNSTAQRSD